MEDTSLLWPELPYEDFAPTMHLLHRGVQMVGKLMLLKPFEPQWANVVLLPTARGLTTGAVPWHDLTFTVETDFIAHDVAVTASNGRAHRFGLEPGSVATWFAALNAALDAVGVAHRVNPVPQEVPDPVPFDQDVAPRPYDRALVEAWWQALLSTYRALQIHHSRFTGKTQPVGLMWGSFDLRDARYGGEPCSAGNAGYIMRNTHDETQSVGGWWPGSAAYPRPAYFAYTYPPPEGIDRANVEPAAAHWDASLGEFILDYDDVRASEDPLAALLSFYESAYEAGRALAGWKDFSCPGAPVREPEEEGS